MSYKRQRESEEERRRRIGYEGEGEKVCGRGCSLLEINKNPIESKFANFQEFTGCGGLFPVN